MKTKEEIEQLAEKHYTQITLSQRTAFKLGYTQCQEDMADKKYTEEDMRELYAYAKTPDVVFYKKNGSKELHTTNLENYLQSLNKQD